MSSRTIPMQLLVVTMGDRSHAAELGSRVTLCGQSRTQARGATSDHAITCSRCRDAVQEVVDMLDRRKVARYETRRSEFRSRLRGERGAAPSTDRRAHLRRSSSLSSRDRWSTTAVVALAALVFMAILGAISLGQLIQRIAGG